MFRGYHSYLVDVGRSVASWQAEFKGHLLQAGWQLLAEDTVNNVLEVIPSSANPVGNDLFYQFLRIKFTSTQVEFIPCLFAREGSPEYGDVFQVNLTNVVGTTRTLNINGESVTVRAGEGSSLREKVALFASRIREDPALMGGHVRKVTLPSDIREGELHADQVNSLYIEGFPSTPLSVEATSGTSSTRVRRVSMRFQGGQEVPSTAVAKGVVVPVNFETGFIYYLSLFDKTISLGIKDTSGFYGPIFGSYADNRDDVLESTPENCPPMELLAGKLEGVYAGASPTARPDDLRTSHVNGIPLTTVPASYQVGVAVDNFTDYATYWEDVRTGSHFGWYDYGDTGSARPMGYQQLVDLRIQQGVTYSNQFGPILSGLGYATATSTMNPPYINSLMFGGNMGIQSAVWSGADGIRMNSAAPVYAVQFHGIRNYYPDVFFFVDNVINESLNVVNDTNVSTKLAVAVGAEDEEVEVEDASVLPEKGTAFIDGEMIAYEGVEGNTLVGCGRGRLGTAPSEHGAGATVSRGAWFVKINNGALLAGYERPQAGK